MAQEAAPIPQTDSPPAKAEPHPLQSGSLLPDPRFGVILTDAGSARDADFAAGLLQALGATVWYSFDERPGPPSGRAQLLRPGVDLGTLAEQAAAAPGTTWLIGVEPNVPGQDDLEPQSYANFVAEVASTIRAMDPTAVLIGPNTLNWDNTCTVCPGFPSGRSWSEAFVDSYRTRHGDLPFNGWGLHTYSLDWQRLPLVNATADQTQLRGAREWLDSQGLDLPLWLTEFGVVWGYDGIEWVQQADAAFVAEPRGSFRVDLLTAYLDQMFDWLLTVGPSLRIERWYLYASIPPREPYASTPVGIALVQPASFDLTEFGQQFRNWAVRPAVVEPMTRQSGTPNAPGTEEPSD